MPEWARNSVARVRDGAWLTRERLVGYSCILLGYEILFAVSIAILVLPAASTGSDFSSFYTAGMLANAGTPQLAYEHAAHHAAQVQLYGRNVPYNFFYYPPIWLMVCAALARLPYSAAVIAFEAVTFAATMAVARRIIGTRDWKLLIPLLAFPPIFWNIAAEQNAFLSAALLGGAMLAIERRPALAGALFGVLAYKPHFGLLVPVALIASSEWRAAAAAAATVIALALLSAGLFGWDIWPTYIDAALASGPVYESGIDIEGVATPYGAALALGAKPALAYALQTAGAIGAAYWVGRTWRREFSVESRAAILIAGIPLVAPVLLFYDLVLGGIAMLWLIRRAAATRFLPWEKSALAAIYLLTLLTGHMNGTPRFLIAPAITAVLFALAVARARSESAERIKPTTAEAMPAYS